MHRIRASGDPALREAGAAVAGRQVYRLQQRSRNFIEEVGMPQDAWTGKRERQYEHIKQGLKKRGKNEATAKEIAARTVNKERARGGEAKTASALSVKDVSSGRRGGQRSHAGEGGRTFAQLYNEARSAGIKGRSRMSKQELLDALGGR
jgi:hypothetical protein